MKSRRIAVSAAAVAITLLVGIWLQLPAIGAGGLLHPARHRSDTPTPAQCVDASFGGAEIALRGWRCSTPLARRGTVIYLHGIADDRGSAAGVIPRFLSRGFDVIAYDSRAHGDSDGDACTYGFFEKDDLRHVLDRVRPGPILLIGTSLGAAIALARAGHVVYAVDTARAMLTLTRRAAREAGVEGNIVPVCADARALPFAADAFGITKIVRRRLES